MSGIDILVDDKMNPWFIELNKKPGMGTHYIKKIGEVKKTIWLDALDISLAAQNTSNGFQLIKSY
jgi:hypothetical protein